MARKPRKKSERKSFPKMVGPGPEPPGSEKRKRVVSGAE
jgi:hypothetical protein